MFSILYKTSVTFAIISHVYGDGAINETYLAQCTQLKTYTDKYGAKFPITKAHYNGQNIFLTFYIKSGTGAKIIVSSAIGQKINKPKTYEVIISARSRNPSQIRTGEGDTLAKHFGDNTLSANEWRPFWIQLSSQGSIRVETLFLSWERKQQLQPVESAAYKNFIDHFAFTSYNDTTVNWAFHCPKNHSNDLADCTKLRTTTYDYDLAYSTDDYVQNGTIFLPFYVKGAKEAHIILSPTTERANNNDLAYEIFLGGYGGNISGIRDVRGSVQKKKYTEYNILSPDEWRPFWIRVSPNGLIEVGKKIGSCAFMSWKAEPPVDYYSIASYKNDAVEWAIECPKRKFRSDYVYVMK